MAQQIDIAREADLWKSCTEFRTLRFDRRLGQRCRIEVDATAFVLAGEHFGEIVEMRLVDLSAEGLGAEVQRPLWPGTSISLGFEHPEMSARRGEVVRCTPCGHGYRIGIRLFGRMAA